MASYIANVYANLILKTETTGKTIDDVPEKLRAEVQAILDSKNETTTEVESDAE